MIVGIRAIEKVLEGTRGKKKRRQCPAADWSFRRIDFWSFGALLYVMPYRQVILTSGLTWEIGALADSAGISASV